MKFDNSILFEFLPDEDKKSFMVWDGYFLHVNAVNIVAVYRAPFEERILIPLIEYELKLKEKSRDNKLNELGI
jgi:hypothetical protein